MGEVPAMSDDAELEQRRQEQRARFDRVGKLRAAWLALSEAERSQRIREAAPKLLLALRDLHDAQNGNPRCWEPETWDKAIAKASELLLELDP